MSKKQNKQQETVTTEVVAIENVAEATVTTKRRGRPVAESSKRQLELAAKAARAQMNGGLVKRGRPVVGESKRQQQLQERLNKMAAGVEIKRGRPKMIKEVVA